MDQIVQQARNVDVLKALNNAIVTSRLYPPEAPQVATAVERGYKVLKVFLREKGSLLFSFQGDLPCLYGRPLDKETLGSFSNLVIFRQLRLIGLSQLLLGPDMDRFAFGQIISVFNASIEKTKKAGGGLAFVTNLGLASYFPEKQEGPQATMAISAPAVARTRKLVKVRPELLACLCGIDKRPALQVELRSLLANTESAVDLLAASVGHILQDIQKKGVFAASHLFPTMLLGAEAECIETDRRPLVLGLARLLAENLREPALVVLLSQEYPEGFGTMLYDGLIGFLSTENLNNIFVLFREKLAKARLADGDTSPQVEFLGKAMHRLMNTGKGKQFLSSEKARAMIHEGEAARKKRRLEAGLHGLLQGNLNTLKSEELAHYIPGVITDKLEAKEEKDVEALLKRIAEYLSQDVETADNTVLMSAVVIGEKLVTDDRLPLTDNFLEPVMEAIRKASASEALLERMVIFLHQVMQLSWNLGQNRRGDIILELFYMVRSGQLDSSPALKDIIGKIQDRGIQRAKLPTLLAECLASPLDEAAGYRLALQGPVAMQFLVESLINSDSSDARIKIIDLLTANNSFLVPVIHDRLPEHMPWYGKRNLLKLLGETGQENDAESVLTYLKHEDFRVQREAFLCLYKISGKNRKRLLLAALAESSELIKIQIIAALSALCDHEVAEHLVELLAENESFSDKNRTDILLQLLETLGRCNCPAAFKGIQSFLQARGNRSSKKILEPVWGVAEKALAHLESDLQETRRKHLQAGKLRKNALKHVGKLNTGASAQRNTAGLPQEQAIRNLLAQGDKSGARDLLMQLIEKSARSHNFFQAENLREWLIEIDPNAFSHIIEVAELIDREKMAAIDKSHLEIWSRLYECLSSEEFSAVYYGQKHKKYLNNEIVVSQGAMQTRLFFINSGKVKLYFEDKGNEVLVKTMGRGEIFGAEAFFEASIWTISVASVGPSEISSLKLDKLREWSEEFPGLESKLHDFCKQFEKIEQFIEKNAKDRRTEERHNISGRVSTMMLDNQGQSIGVSAMIELSDISVGGISYQVNISKKDNARLLLGRKVQIKLAAGEKSGEFSMVTGDILSVRSSDAENDYSVHVKLDAALDERRIQEIIRAASREAQLQ